MAKLSDLPNELVDEIWAHVLDPKDIENLALASKRIRAIGGRVLLEHRKLTDDFSTFVLGDRRARFSAAGLLKKVLTNPHIALYVKNISIMDYHRCWDDDDVVGVNMLREFDPEAGVDVRHYRHTQYTEEDTKLIEQAIERAKRRVGFYPDVGIRHGHEMPIIEVLLLVFANLKTITIDEQTACESFFNMLYSLSEGMGVKAVRRPIEVRFTHVGWDKSRDHLRITNACERHLFTYLRWHTSASAYYGFNLPLWTLNT